MQPDIGLGIDVTLSCDTPGVPTEEAITTQGKGFGLHIKDSSFISDHSLVAEVEAVAKKNRIPFRRTILAAGGQDGAAAQQAAAGAAGRRDRCGYALHPHRDGDDRQEDRNTSAVPCRLRLQVGCCWAWTSTKWARVRT